METLDHMNAKVKAGQHKVQSEFAIAGLLTAGHIRGRNIAGTVCGAATVFCCDTAQLKWGTYIVRTDKGCAQFGRVHSDQYVYVPFYSRSRHNPCVLKIKQLLLVRQSGFGWPDDECRLAVGVLYDNLVVRAGVGLETTYNDEPSQGSCQVPRILFASKYRLERGYAWAVHLRQIKCPVAHIPGDSGSTFITTNKVGYHGDRDTVTDW